MNANAHVLKAGSSGGGVNRSQVRVALAVLGLLLAAVALGAYLVWSGGSERRALARMPEAERQGLFERTRATLLQDCAKPPSALQGYCQEQADLLSNFPECDASCQALVAQRRPLQSVR